MQFLLHTSARHRVEKQGRRQGKIDVVLLINVQKQSPQSDTFLSVATWIDNKTN